MKPVVALLVLYVAILAGTKAVATSVAPEALSGSQREVVGRDQQSRVDHKQVVGQAGVTHPAFTLSTPISARPAGTKTSSPVAASSEVKCPCGPDCDCASEDICKAKDCERNYILLFTAKWCVACPRQKVIMDRIIKDGYIVHVIDVDENDKAAKHFKVTSLPAVVVMDAGKEVNRYVGVTVADKVTANVKRRAEQPESKNDGATDYDFR